MCEKTLKIEISVVMMMVITMTTQCWWLVLKMDVVSPFNVLDI